MVIHNRLDKKIYVFDGLKVTFLSQKAFDPISINILSLFQLRGY